MLNIHSGIRWSDGQALDADDIVFTLNLMNDASQSLSEAASIQQWVNAVEKIVPLTMQVLFEIT